jgi:DNA invertase Pin-like site-specific DNA recombinase
VANGQSSVVRGKIDVVAAWSVDRLGRSLQDLVGFLGELNAAGLRPLSRKAGDRHNHPCRTRALPDARRIRRVRACDHSGTDHTGLARAREKGTKSGKPIGRARIDPTREAAIRAALASGNGILKTARQCGTGTSVVQRIKAEMARAANADT